MTQRDESPPKSGIGEGRSPQTETLDRKLAALPDVPLSPMMSASVRRQARIAFLEARTEASLEPDGDALAMGAMGTSPLALVWTRTVLPVLLLLMGAAYTASSIAGMAHVYLGN